MSGEFLSEQSIVAQSFYKADFILKAEIKSLNEKLHLIEAYWKAQEPT